MATAQAQDKFTLKCDLCHSDRDIKWKCQDCDEWYCYNCKTAHSKSKATKGHKVVSLSNADVTEQQQIKSKFCNDHPDEQYYMYCKDCQQSICLRCITGRHKAHDFLKLSDIIDEKDKELSDFLDSMKANQLADLEKSVKQLQDDQTNYDKKTDGCLAEIKEQGRQLKDTIDEIISATISDLERRAIDDRKFMKEMETQYTQQLSEVRETIQTSEEKMKSTSHAELIQLVTDVKNALQKYKNTKPPIRIVPPSFICNKPDHRVLKKQLGCLDFEENDDEKASECDTMVTTQSPVSHTKIKVISNFQHCSSVYRIACWKENEAWIAKDKQIALVQNDGQVVKSVDCGYYVFGVGATHKGKLLVASGHKIQTLNDKEAGTTDLCNTSSFITDICITADDDIYGCQLTEVVKLSSTGKIKQTINFEDGKYAGVKEVDYITQNVNSDLWITSVKSNCVVVLTINGKFRFHYTGPTGIKMEEIFGPRKIICNKNGQALIVDTSNHKIHLVDRDGQFLQFLLTEQHGLKNPISISQDKEGRIWVGCERHTTVIVAEYLS